MKLVMPEVLTEQLIRDAITASGQRGIRIGGIPNATYHAGPGISSSDIKKVLTGPINAWLESKASPKKQTPALALGNAIHCMVLEPDQFWKRYILLKDVPKALPRNTKPGKDAWEAYRQQTGDGREMKPEEWQVVWLNWKHPGYSHLELIEQSDVDICSGIAESITKHPEVSKLFFNGESESTLYWVDEQTNILCKARPDRLNRDFPCVPDLKSTQSARLEDFEQDITVHHYHVSAWWYLWGAKTVEGFDFRDFVYIPAEKVKPFNVTYYLADEGSLTIAEGLCRAGLAIIKRWQDAVAFQAKTNPASTVWSGYSLEPKPAGIRPWAFNELSNVIAEQDLHGMGLERFVGVV